MEFIKNCPVCDHLDHDLFLQAKDNLVSKSDFDLVKCSQCGFVFTNPRPAEENISAYYQSDEYISHSGESKSLFDRLYNIIRNKNITYKLDLISPYKKENARLLDYGCAVGAFLNEAQKEDWIVQGFEPNSKAKEIAIKSGVEVLDFDALLLQKEKFDVITLWHVLEHIHNLNEVVGKLKTMLKDDGALIIAIPIIDSFDALHYNGKWAALDVPRHLYHFSFSTFDRFIRNFGMQIVNTYPLKFDSYYISLLSENNGIFKYPKAIWNGWRSNLKARKSGKYSSLIFMVQKAKE